MKIPKVKMTARNRAATGTKLTVTYLQQALAIIYLHRQLLSYGSRCAAQVQLVMWPAACTVM